MAYLGQSLTEGTRRVYNYVATASQTTFNAVYGVGAVDVYQNGVLLAEADYVATTGTTVVLGTGAAVNDEITIACHLIFSVADTYTKGEVYTQTEADARYISQGTPTGGGLFKGENGTVGSSAGDIFRINEQTLNTNTTIDADENASCAGPLTLATGVTLTVNGNLTVV
jgi:hypothetical protein